MGTYASVLQIAIIFFVALIGVEWIASVLMKRKVYRSFDTISSLSSGLTNNIKSIFKLSVIVVSYKYMSENWALYNIEAGFWTYILAFIGIDFASYWSHRWNHHINLFWNRHIVHHSSEEYNLAAALRQSISDIVQIYFFLYVPMALIGIPTSVIAVVAPLHLFAQFWYHTKLINKMGFLEHIIMTPSHHRVHHALNKEYIDKNFAAIFIVWDKWFGSFQEELEEVPPVYGVKKAVRTWNPFLINFMHLWQLVKDAWRAEKFYDKMRIWFMPTGWRPADVNEKYPIEFTEHAKDQVKYDTEATPGLIYWSWFQLVLHLIMQIHLIRLLPDVAYGDLLFYGIFVLISVYAYTSLMDRHWLAIPIEVIKVVLGLVLIYHMNGWYHLDTVLPLATYGMIFYLFTSLGLTLYYSFFQKIEIGQQSVS